MNTVNIPDGFLLGVATSAYQIEGAHDRGGRGPSVWDTFTQTPGRVQGNIPGNRGAEHYDRLEEDLDIMKDLGIESYRLSLSWSRLIPDGVGEVNAEGANFYNRLIDGLLARGITPNVTLYHWDLPQKLQDLGGWANRDVIEWFATYARTAFDLFGDRVPLWSTLNEPISLWMGYGVGFFAPGLRDPRQGKQAMHNAMVAHGRAVQEFRASGATGQIGIVIDVWKRHVVAETAENHALANRDEDDTFRFFYDELFAGGLSERIQTRLKAEGTLPDIHAGDAEVSAEPIDFLGLNVYGRLMIDSTNYKANPFEGTEQLPGGNYLSNGMELYPDVLMDALHVIRDEYGVTVPVYVTENGTPADGQLADGVVEDDERIRYVGAFLQKSVEAYEAGLGVKGYYLWTLMDNYEWAAGYSMRYGIVRTDPETFERSYKKSGHWYKAVNQNRSFTPVG
ncbi:glycoside hydrolase family 1 protein [Paenarthrobacter sp. YAF11_1]|uniref:glycoside hydrolase family 1 protein n=1 Tax=Paenarthrobacter sp. YAF11_1 TaxID=3233074 RepID=UPI003F9524B0